MTTQQGTSGQPYAQSSEAPGEGHWYRCGLPADHRGVCAEASASPDTVQMPGFEVPTSDPAFPRPRQIVRDQDPSDHVQGVCVDRDCFCSESVECEVYCETPAMHAMAWLRDTLAATLQVQELLLGVGPIATCIGEHDLRLQAFVDEITPRLRGISLELLTTIHDLEMTSVEPAIDWR